MSLRELARCELSVIAVALSLSLLLAKAYSFGFAPVAGVVAGSFLGIVNFAALYRFGVKLLFRTSRESDGSGNNSTNGPGDNSSNDSGNGPDSRRQSVPVIASVGVRLPMVVAGLAVIAESFGLCGLLSGVVMFFAVQIPLFVRIANITGDGTADVDFCWR